MKKIELKNKEKVSFVLVTDDRIIFPGLMMHLTLDIFQKDQIKILKKFYEQKHPVGVILKKSNTMQSVVKKKDIYLYGTKCQILDVRTINVDKEAKIHIVLRGFGKFKVNKVLGEHIPGCISVDSENIQENTKDPADKESKEMKHSLKVFTLQLLRKDPDFPTHGEDLLQDNLSSILLSYFAASISSATLDQKQKILEEKSIKKKLEQALDLVVSDLDLWDLRRNVRSKVNKTILNQQKETYIRHEIEALQKEIESPEISEISLIEKKAKDKKWSVRAKSHFEGVMKKIKRTPSSSPDFSVNLNQADFLVSLPWDNTTQDNIDFGKTKDILNNRHYGMDKVKDRVLEFLAVMKLKGTTKKSPILCLCGPPGVGKTSLGKSIAESLNRKYTKISLGAISDEAEIRGHRKTYIGAMPGKILTNIKAAESSNPIFMLDEVDKISDRKGSPEAALLEVLDPEQNHAFVDNYVEIPYDLSKVMFIATANYLDNVSPPLRDRMEVINIGGYSVEEKKVIAKDYILSKQKEEHGLKDKDLYLNDSAIEKLITSYTCESGVRELKRKVATITRKIAKNIVMGKKYKKNLNKNDIVNLLGPEIYDIEMYEKHLKPGIATGLAYTPFGGEILFIESTAVKGKGEIILSGQLGDVMKESAMAAMSYLKSKYKDLKINYKLFEKYDLHIHVPDGATPKDGPSAGIALFTALASLYTQRSIVDKMSMSGELTLRGQVSPVGGVKEKVLAAKRAGINKIILSKRNEKDVKEIKAEYLKNVTFKYVNTVDEVLDIALHKKICDNPIKWGIK